MRRWAVLQSDVRSMVRGRRISVGESEKGLLYRFGRLDAVLDPGPHRRWGAGFSVRIVDMRPWVITVPAQEIPTADMAPVKITVAGRARVTDPAVYVTAARETNESLYLAIQVALREMVAASTLDDLLAGRADAGGRLLDSLRGVDELGLVVDQLVIKDIVMPGELKRALAEVVTARAVGQAALERSRGETAVLRSLANAARLAADNPALIQLRLLQQLDATTGHTVVIGTPPFMTSSPAPPAEPGSRHV